MPGVKGEGFAKCPACSLVKFLFEADNPYIIDRFDVLRVFFQHKVKSPQGFPVQFERAEGNSLIVQGIEVLRGDLKDAVKIAQRFLRPV